MAPRGSSSRGLRSRRRRATRSATRQPAGEGKTRVPRPSPLPLAGWAAAHAWRGRGGTRGGRRRGALGAPSRPARMRRRRSGGSPVAGADGSRYPPVRMSRGARGRPAPPPPGVKPPWVVLAPGGDRGGRRGQRAVGLDVRRDAAPCWQSNAPRGARENIDSCRRSPR